MAFATASAVLLLAQVEANDFKTGSFADTTAIEAFLSGTAIPDAEEIVQDYCRATWTDSTVPDGVKVVTARVAVNILQNMIVRMQGPLVRVGDYKVQLAQQDPLTPELKQMLSKHRAHTKYVKSTDYKTDEAKDQWDE